MVSANLETTVKAIASLVAQGKGGVAGDDKRNYRTLINQLRYETFTRFLTDFIRHAMSREYELANLNPAHPAFVSVKELVDGNAVVIGYALALRGRIIRRFLLIIPLGASQGITVVFI